MLKKAIFLSILIALTGCGQSFDSQSKEGIPDDDLVPLHVKFGDYVKIGNKTWTVEVSVYNPNASPVCLIAKKGELASVSLSRVNDGAVLSQSVEFLEAFNPERVSRYIEFVEADSSLTKSSLIDLREFSAFVHADGTPGGKYTGQEVLSGELRVAYFGCRRPVGSEYDGAVELKRVVLPLTGKVS